MGTIADKLTYLNATKTAIKNAIVNKGVSISDTDTFRSYADKIASIETGSQPQLNAPTISITDNTLTITNPTSNGDFVTAYKVYAEYGYVATVTEITVDLTTIITENGTYNVFVTCVGTNFEDSIASNAVSWTLMTLATPQNVTANGTTVSWDEVENATSYEIYADGVSIGTVENTGTDPLAGTWVLNETLNSTEISPQNISFQSGGESFTELKYLNDDAGGYSLFFGDKNVARTIIRTGVTTWYYSENRTITFETAPTGDLLAWLQANATKQ